MPVLVGVLNALNEAQEVTEQQEPELCYDVTVPECRQMGFTHTKFPNIFGHTTPEEMSQDMTSLTGLILSGCSDDLLPLICAAYLPTCDPDTGDVINACKETCRRISKDCKDAMKELSIGRLDIFTCRNYPSKKDGKCVEGKYLKDNKVQLWRGRAAEASKPLTIFKGHFGGYFSK